MQVASSTRRGVSGLVGLWMALLAGLLLAGCGTTYLGKPLQTEDYLIPGRDPGTQLFIRNKFAADKTVFTGDHTVLFVHGATYPSETSFDLRVGGFSWMDYIAARGYDVYLLDIRGYGRSSRPPAMSAPPEANPPFATTEEAARDIDAAVDFILKRRSIRRLNLIGWSWGTTTTALYTTRNNDKVAKLVLYAPVWTPPAGVTPGPVPTSAYRSVTMDAAHKRWTAGVPEQKVKGLIPEGWFETWWKAVLDSDPEGARQNPPVVRAPNGSRKDSVTEWQRGRPTYDASRIRVPTLLVKAEWDADTPASMAQGLFAALTNAPRKLYTEIGEGTHSVILEKNRMVLFRVVQNFLEERGGER